MGLNHSEDEACDDIPHETTDQTGLSHKKWTVAAARFAIGKNYPSFFICMRDEPVLDFGGLRHPDGQGFAAFGQLTAGFDTANAIFSSAEPEEFLTNQIKILSVSHS